MRARYVVFDVGEEARRGSGSGPVRRQTQRRGLAVALAAVQVDRHASLLLDIVRCRRRDGVMLVLVMADVRAGGAGLVVTVNRNSAPAELERNNPIKGSRASDAPVGVKP